jgi:hypothetical protein
VRFFICGAIRGELEDCSEQIEARLHRLQLALQSKFDGRIPRSAARSVECRIQCDLCRDNQIQNLQLLRALAGCSIAGLRLIL